MMRPTFYRFATLGRPRAPWRATREEAEADALEHDCARIDGGRLGILVPGDLLMTDAAVTPEPRDLTRAQRRMLARHEEVAAQLDAIRRARTDTKKGPTSTSAPTRIDRAIARREARRSGAF